MASDSFPRIIVFLFCIFLGSVSQVMLKKAAQRQYISLIGEYLNPLVILAYVLFLLTTVLGVWIYQKVPLSLGPVLETTSYLYITFFGVYIFHEKMSRGKYIALILIILGVLIYAF